jgi:hypothetical protein
MFQPTVACRCVHSRWIPGWQPALEILQILCLQLVRLRNAALLVVSTAGVDEHVEAINVHEVTAHFDANRGLGIWLELIAPVLTLEQREVLAVTSVPPAAWESAPSLS